MSYQENEFAFCTLALGARYRSFTKDLADDLALYFPGVSLIVGTDRPEDFAGLENVKPFRHRKQGILHCYHDKRFIIAKTLANFHTAIQIDADTRLTGSLQGSLVWSPGITAGHIRNLVEHLEKYNPARLGAVKKVSAKLDVSLEHVNFVGESLFVVTRDKGKEKEFLRYWDIIGKYLELRGIHSGEGATIGLAAAKAKLDISRSPGYEALNTVRRHLDATDNLIKRQRKSSWETLWDPWKRRLNYHYRLNLARLIALKDFRFYYL